MRLNRNTWYSFGNATNWLTEWWISFETAGLCVESSTCLMLTLLTVRVRLGITRTLKPDKQTDVSCCKAFRLSAVALYRFIKLFSTSSTKTVFSVLDHLLSNETEWFAQPFRLARKKNNMVTNTRIDESDCRCKNKNISKTNQKKIHSPNLRFDSFDASKRRVH